MECLDVAAHHRIDDRLLRRTVEMAAQAPVFTGMAVYDLTQDYRWTAYEHALRELGCGGLVGIDFFVGQLVWEAVEFGARFGRANREATLLGSPRTTPADALARMSVLLERAYRRIELAHWPCCVGSNGGGSSRIAQSAAARAARSSAASLHGPRTSLRRRQSGARRGTSYGQPGGAVARGDFVSAGIGACWPQAASG
ncbi:MAG TPA: hypothetical protein VGM69_19765 [Chloroflexota bacterium]